MKELLVFILLFFTYTITIAQDLSDEQKTISANNIYKKIITGKEYNNGTLIDESYIEELYDSLGRTIEFIVYEKKGSIKNRYIHSYSKDGNTETRKQYDNNNELGYTYFAINYPKKRKLVKMQLNSDNDTLNHQIWLKDINYEDSILYRIKNGVTKIQREYKYDKYGKRVSQQYSINGLTTHTTQEIDKNCITTKNKESIIIAKVCKDENKTTYYSFENREGYLYGITLKREIEGKVVYEKTKLNLDKSRIHYSKENKVFAIIEYEYLIKK